MPDNPIYQILTPAGDVIGDVPDLADETLVGLYRWMVMARIFSDRMVALQRQGRMGTFAPLNGQEATCVAMAAPLEEKDWLLGSYRESFPYIVKGAATVADETLGRPSAGRLSLRGSLHPLSNCASYPGAARSGHCHGDKV